MLETVKTPGDTRWFTHDRFGMFIHWGLYALPARHEWIKNKEQISDEEYEKYFKHFDPDLYDPNLWAEAAAKAGMKYFVITTKHHEGFCLWDSKLTDYKSTKTPAKRDLLRPMVEAFRNRNLRTGFYHSLIDWHHPDFTIDGFHPQRSRENFADINAKMQPARYAEYLHGQVKELLTEFGRIDVMWFDFSYANRKHGVDGWVGEGKGRDYWQSEKLLRLVRELQPHVVLDDRLDLPDGWDVKTPEQWQPRDWVRVDGKPVVWEACQTFSGSWGYHRDESSWKSVEVLLRMLIDSVSIGGNLLLNVGPTGRGEFDQRALDRLYGMGKWMKYHSRSIYGCTQAPEEFKAPQDCRLTYNPTTKRLYMHVMSWPFRDIYFDNMAGKIAYAQLLNDASEIPFHDLPPDNSANHNKTTKISLPIQKPDVVFPVVEIFLK